MSNFNSLVKYWLAYFIDSWHYSVDTAIRYKCNGNVPSGNFWKWQSHFMAVKRWGGLGYNHLRWRENDAVCCYVMLWYVMVCYVMLCYVMVWYVMLCYAMICYVMLCYVMLCYVMLCYVMLCYLMLCHVMLCNVILCYVMLYHIMLYHVM